MIVLHRLTSATGDVPGLHTVYGFPTATEMTEARAREIPGGVSQTMAAFRAYGVKQVCCRARWRELHIRFIGIEHGPCGCKTQKASSSFGYPYFFKTKQEELQSSSFMD